MGAAWTAKFLSRKVKDAGPEEKGRPRTITLTDVKQAGPPLSAHFFGLLGTVILNFIEGSPPAASDVLYVPGKDASVWRLVQAAEKAKKHAASLLHLGG